MQKNVLNLIELELEQIQDVFARRGIERYRGDQVVDWIYKKAIFDFDRMTNLPAALRSTLREHFMIQPGKVIFKNKSREDDSVKVLLELKDKQMVEMVYIPRGSRRTVCVSSQVGCKFGCVFCASGQAGYTRQLSAGEITAQVLRARELGEVTHVVFMGMGEPLDNFDAVMKAIRRLNHPKGLNIGARRMTVSTSGLVSKIERFSDQGTQVELSVSLHGARDEIRGKLMPINRRWPVKELIQSCREYSQKTGRLITFEYLLAKGLNASTKDARELSRLLKGLMCKVNLIPLNPIPEFPYKRPSYKEILSFQKILKISRINATVRFSRGNDINAACGQLRKIVQRQNRVQ